MEFTFDVQRLFGDPPRGVVCLEGRKLGSQGASSSSRDCQFREVIDTMGAQSAKAQKLQHTISSFRRLLNSDQRLYMKVDRSRAVGYIKVGPKRLFIATRQSIAEIEPLCVLDFYVHESVQRQGEGQILFQYMLDNEQKSAHQLGYDKPSAKFMKFLSSRYSLCDYIPQNNNFVVFSKYFAEDNTKPSSAPSMASRGDSVPAGQRPQISPSESRANSASNTVSQNGPPSKREKSQNEPRAIDSVAACLGLTSHSQSNPRPSNHKHHASVVGLSSYLSSYQATNCKRGSLQKKRELCALRPF
eukprot:GEMP01049379.1.p1 GENE.GEMP01049379.1~~GEMP01049379.1.p1  ORF type:complete len:301 (+),score=42.99 GEMP01049379.1:67-969(+)